MVAAYYRNEADVGKAIADSGIDRSEIFVTTKLWTGFGGPIDYNGTLAALQDSLKKLKLEYVDLYLIHSPNDKHNRLEQWRALESAKRAGLVKSIGETATCACTHTKVSPFRLNMSHSTSFEPKHMDNDKRKHFTDFDKYLCMHLRCQISKYVSKVLCQSMPCSSFPWF